MKLYTMLPNQDWSWLSRWLIHLAWWVVSWQSWIFPRKLIFCQGPGQRQLLFFAKQILMYFKGPLKDYLRTCKGPLKNYWRTIKAIRAIYRIVRPLGLVSILGRAPKKIKSNSVELPMSQNTALWSKKFGTSNWFNLIYVSECICYDGTLYC